jgi:putative protease
VTDLETGDELEIDNEYVMSPKDMCTIGFIDKMIESGSVVLKLEGRGKAPEYVYTVTKCYREAVDSYYNGTYTKKKIKKLTDELKTVYNRGFWDGYYRGKKLDMWAGEYGSQATKEKIYVGRAENYYKKLGIAQFGLDANSIRKGDDLIITGPTTGILKQKAKSLFINEKEVDIAPKGSVVTFPIKEIVRKNDKLFIYKDIKK